MKRSDINSLIRSAMKCFSDHFLPVPENARWDVTDFGLGNWRNFGLVLVNLAEEPEYCEKQMYARKDMETVAHCHKKKKEDIICRWGTLHVQVWPGLPDETHGKPLRLAVNNEMRDLSGGDIIVLNAGDRVRLLPNIYHAFWPESAECIIGEVSTANDDFHDNFFVDPNVGRFPHTEEDEPPLVRLISDK